MATICTFEDVGSDQAHSSVLAAGPGGYLHAAFWHDTDDVLYFATNETRDGSWRLDGTITLQSPPGIALRVDAAGGVHLAYQRPAAGLPQYLFREAPDDLDCDGFDY